MTLAIDIKKQFPDLRVFDYDEVAFVKAILYKDDVEMMEIRIEEKKPDTTFSNGAKEYWVTSRIVSVPDLPSLPKVRNEGVEVFNKKQDMFNKIEDMLSYARAL